jgi:hypothetical protein
MPIIPPDVMCEILVNGLIHHALAPLGAAQPDHRRGLPPHRPDREVGVSLEDRIVNALSARPLAKSELGRVLGKRRRQAMSPRSSHRQRTHADCSVLDHHDCPGKQVGFRMLHRRADCRGQCSGQRQTYP